MRMQRAHALSTGAAAAAAPLAFFFAALAAFFWAAAAALALRSSGVLYTTMTLLAGSIVKLELHLGQSMTLAPLQSGQ